MAMGFAIAQQLIQQQGGFLNGPASSPGAPSQATPPAARLPKLLAPADVAQVLGVSEQDVLATIEAGDLKAKKIGSVFRVTQTALDEFLNS